MSSVAKVRLGMIGCGAIAEIYHLPALEKIEGVVGNTVLVEPNADRLDANPQGWTYLYDNHGGSDRFAVGRRATNDRQRSPVDDEDGR